MKKFNKVLLIIFLLMFLLAACGGGDDTASGDGADYRMAAIFPGTIIDADYNTLGHIGLTTVRDELGVEIAFSESVAVPDVDRVMREYIDDGNNIIFTHGGQFLNQTRELAAEFPEVYFIAEADAEIADLPANVWVMVRNMEIGAYGAGALSGMLSSTGKVGYISGLTLPFSYAEVHAIQQAFSDNGQDVEVVPVWVGDFNDPAKARELSDALIADGVDVIISSLNLGTLGVFEAAENASTEVLVIAKYTDKSEFSPNNYVTSMLYDFAGPLVDMVTSIMGGETSGNYHLGFDTGIGLQFPLTNVPDGVEADIQAIIDKMIAGDINVVKDTEVIE